MMSILGIFNFGKNSREATQKKGSAGAITASYTNNVAYVTTAESALKIAAVYRAVDLISNGLATLTLQYKRLNKAKNYYVLDTGGGRKINYLLSARPNSRQNAFTFFKNVAANMLLQGNAYILPRYDDKQYLEELILLSPNTVMYDVWTNRYHVIDVINGISDMFYAEEIIHLKNISVDGGYQGLSTISAAAQSLNIAATADKETLKKFATGGRFKAVLQNNDTTKTVGLDGLKNKEDHSQKDDIQEALQRGDDIILVQGENKLQPLSMTSTDMQFLENKKFNIREIARFFNVPPSKLMDDSNANYKSAELSNVAFYAEALQPLATQIEKEFSAKLLNEKTFLDYKFSFDLTKLYALDLETKGHYNKTRLETGQATVNDMRREDDKEPVDGGDEVYLSVNLAALNSDKLGKKIEEE